MSRQALTLHFHSEMSCLFVVERFGGEGRVVGNGLVGNGSNGLARLEVLGAFLTARMWG